MSGLRTLALLALIGVSYGQASDCSYLSLLNHLNLTETNNPLKIMRPVKNWTQPTAVKLDMLLYGILDVDEKSQTFTSHIWVQMGWINEYLTWNSADFCGIDMLTVPTSMLWIPDVTIQEDVSDSGSTRISPYVSFFPDGSVIVTKLQRLTSTCHMELFLFPFDIQNCEITFSSLNYDDRQIKIGPYNSGENLTSVSEKIMVTQGEWQLKNIKIHVETISPSDAPETRVVYMVTMSRKPLLYVVDFIVPLLYFLVLDLASFFVSESQGEKLSFKITLLLSISVLMLILKDMLPSTENTLPLIAGYCVGIFTMVGIGILEAMLVSFLIDLDATKEDQRSSHTQVQTQMEANNIKEPAAAEGKDQVNPVKSHLPLDWTGNHNLLTLILEEVKAARQEVGERGKGERKPGRYKRLAEIIDSVFFALYLLVFITFLLTVFITWSQNYR